MFYESVARGADSIQFFRWRTARFGAEEYWRGVLDHDNIPRRRYEEAAQIGREIKTVAPEILGTSVRVDAAIACCDQDVEEAHNAMPLGFPSPKAAAETVHAALLNRGYATGLIHPEDDLDGVKLYVIPHWAAFNESWVVPLERFVRGGGVLVIGARTGTKDMHNRVVASTPPGCLRDLTGIRVEESGKINDSSCRPLAFSIDGASVCADTWYEQLQLDEDVSTVAAWESRHLAGMPAISRKDLGDGRVFYVGTQLSPEVLEVLLPVLVKSSGLVPLIAGVPECVTVSVREAEGKRLYFLVNHSDASVMVNVPDGTELISGTRVSDSLELAAFDVAIVRT
jgi:beta-galactosidase